VLCNAAAVVAMVMALAGVPQQVDTTLNTYRVRGTPAGDRDTAAGPYNSLSPLSFGSTSVLFFVG